MLLVEFYVGLVAYFFAQFGNGHLLPRGILREPAENIKRADFIFITKSDGNTDALRARLRSMNEKAEIAECRHRPRYYKNAFSSEILPLEAVNGMKVVTLSGIAAPMSFEKSVSKMGAKILSRERYPDHYRYKAQDIIDVINNADELKADAILTTEKDAVRLPWESASINRTLCPSLTRPIPKLQAVVDLAVPPF